MKPMNKQQLAVAMECSLSSLTDMLARHGAAFPVANHGSNGRAFEFDPRAVVAHLRRCGDHRADVLEAKLPRRLVNRPRSNAATDVMRWSRMEDIQDALDADIGQVVLYCEMIAGIAEAGAMADRNLVADIRGTLEAAKAPETTIRAVQGKVKAARRAFTAEVEALFAPAFSERDRSDEPAIGGPQP